MVRRWNSVVAVEDTVYHLGDFSLAYSRPVELFGPVMYGLQCPKRLYLDAHEPELAGPVSSVQQTVFDQGSAVGILAQK